MADIHRLRTADELDAEACDWLARLTSSTVSQEDRTRFEQWRAAHPRHAQAFDEASVIWHRLLDIGELTRAVSTGQKFNTMTEKAIRGAVRARARSRRTAVAAAAIVAALCLVWRSDTPLGGAVFQTRIGEHSTVKLPDGSSLELNSNSRVRIAYSDRARVSRLERGEAYFDVKRDSRRPFWVAAGKSWVGAVGTAFSVDMRASSVRVTVSEGAVKIASGVTGLTPPARHQLTSTTVPHIQAGQQLDLLGGTIEVRSLKPSQLDQSLAWRQGRIYFKGDRLANVVEELGRYSTLEIIFEDEGLRDFTFAGTFETNADGVEAVLTSLEDAFGLGVRREGRNVYIFRQ